MSSTAAESPTHIYEPPAAAIWAARLVALVAASAASYLVWASVAAGNQVAGCGDQPGFDCASVLSSRWSHWLGLPVGGPGVLVYAALFVALWGIGPAASERTQREAWRTIVPLATLAAGAASWFSALQLFEIHSLCFYCLGVHSCGILLAAFTFWYLPLHRASAAEVAYAEPVFLRPRTAGLLVVAGLAAVAGLIAGQVLGPQTQQDVLLTEIEPAQPGSNHGLSPGTTQEHGEAAPRVGKSETAAPVEGTGTNNSVTSPTTNTTAGSDDSETSPSLPLVGISPSARRHRRMQLLGGKTSVDVYELPVVGDPEAEVVLVELFDYTCSHCRAMHPMMHEARERYGSQFAVVLLPNPMNKRCNRYVQVDLPAHKEACVYARLALAVWYAKPEVFLQYHDWLMESPDVPLVEQAQRVAEELLGKDELAAALADKRIDRQINEDGRIYHLAGHGPIPKLIGERFVMSGQPPAEDKLFEVMEKQFGLVR